jgi:uncharacterized protein RhaS with RHS repeats
MVVLADNPTVGVRYYNPVTGRYVNRDPAGFGDGFNVYLYVHNNPINRIDPLGLGTNPPDNGNPPDGGSDNSGGSDSGGNAKPDKVPEPSGKDQEVKAAEPNAEGKSDKPPRPEKGTPEYERETRALQKGVGNKAVTADPKRLGEVSTDRLKEFLKGTEETRDIAKDPAQAEERIRAIRAELESRGERPPVAEPRAIKAEAKAAQLAAQAAEAAAKNPGFWSKAGQAAGKAASAAGKFIGGALNIIDRFLGAEFYMVNPALQNLEPQPSDGVIHS